MRRALIVYAGTLVMMTAATSAAQTPQPPATAQPAAAANAGPEAPKKDAASAGYSYNAEGRRDPFVSLIDRGSEPSADRPRGLSGLPIGDITVTGILRDRSGFLATVAAPDNKTYIIRAGVKLLDGTVKAITADTVVFSQDVNDPLSLVKEREVRKSVRPAEGRG